MSSQINQLLEQEPAGFLPRVYYGLQQGQATYRFLKDSSINQQIDGNIGDAFSLNSQQETDDYISAIAIKEDDETLKIIIQGDYTIQTNTFNALNMRTGETTEITIENDLYLQYASYLGDYPAQDNKEKQITALKSIEFNKNNVVFASVDYSSDGIYNWVRIGGYLNGKDGKAIYNISQTNYDTITSILQEGDMLIAIGNFNNDNIDFANYNLYVVDTINPLSLTLLGNIKGEKGDTGMTGEKGDTGENGLTPHIQDDYWYIGEVNTNVKAVGTDGAKGEDGQAFNIQSGLFSTIDNYGNQNNVGPEGETLNQLPTLPQSDITGKGYVVYDPITTPLAPYYDLYWANNGDSEWTIIHPFSGIKGQDGTDGQTPYIQNNNWYIGNTNTGVPATGPQGTQGVGITDIEITPKGSSTTDGNWYDMNITLSNGQKIFAGDFEAPKGSAGAEGKRGFGIKEIYNRSDRESMGYTVTTLQAELDDGTQLPTFELRAKNGKDATGNTLYMYSAILSSNDRRTDGGSTWENISFNFISKTLYDSNNLLYPGKIDLSAVLQDLDCTSPSKFLSCSGSIVANMEYANLKYSAVGIYFDSSSNSVNIMYAQEAKTYTTSTFPIIKVYGTFGGPWIEFNVLPVTL